MDIKQTLADFVATIDPKLKQLWEEELSRSFGFNDKQRALVEKMILHSQEHNLRPAKRLRGSFTYYGFKLGKETHEDVAWEAAMAVELVHTALLMHDDVMDQDDSRRGGPTTHKFFENGDVHYGESMAYTVGDAVLSLGYEKLSLCGADASCSLKATQEMLRGIVQTAYGQAYDVSLEKMKDEWIEDDVITLHKAKTAIYTYKNPLFIGAILGGIEDEKVFDVLERYSMSGGVAFQLQDDILGIFGDSDKTGKSDNSDLLQGKGTLLILKTFSDGSEEEVAALEKVWGKRVADEGDIQKAKEAIESCGAREYSRTIAVTYAKEAAEIAEELRGLDVQTEAVDYIQGVAEYMVTREV